MVVGGIIEAIIKMKDSLFGVLLSNLNFQALAKAQFPSFFLLK